MSGTNSLSRRNKRVSINDIALPPDLIKGLSKEVLKELSKQDEATFFQFFEGLNLENVSQTRKKSTQIREENKAIAVQTLELEPKFEEMKSKLLEKSSVLSSLKEEYDGKFQQLKVIQNKMNHQAVEKELAQTVKKTEQESEDLASDFIGGKSSLEIEEFTQKFLEQRTIFWLRKVKLAGMKELLDYRPTPGPRTVHTTPQPLSIPPQHTPYPSEPSASLPPYPSNNVMPQPFPAAAYKTPPPKPPAYAGVGPNRFNQHRY